MQSSAPGTGRRAKNLSRYEVEPLRRVGGEPEADESLVVVVMVHVRILERAAGRRLGQGGFGFPAFAFATAYSTIASAAFTPTASRRPWNPGDALTSSTYGVVPRKIMSTPLISRPTAFDARTAIDFE